MESLARRSFALHARLADEVEGEWSYRRLTTYSGVHGASGFVSPRGAGGDLGWLSPDVILDLRLGTPETTAQVHPGQFTAAIMGKAQSIGAELHRGEVEAVVRGRDEQRIIGVQVDGETVEGDAVVIAMGPWSILASQWLPLPAVYGHKGHSLVFETGHKLSADALFLEVQEETGTVQSLEVFPRADGTTWVCAVPSNSSLPMDPADVTPDPGAIERLQALCSWISPVLARSRIIAGQTCFRPVAQDGLPLIGSILGLTGAYVATGHSVWGILNAPATGEAMAELILDGATRNVDLSPFDPRRLPTLDPSPLHNGIHAGTSAPSPRRTRTDS